MISKLLLFGNVSIILIDTVASNNIGINIANAIEEIQNNWENYLIV